MNISLVIPAYNESESAPHTVAKLRTALEYLPKNRNVDSVEVIFVDDGSKDNTAQLLREEFKDNANVHVVSHDRNRGLGAAMRTGFQNAKGDIIITTDFDGTYSFNTIPQLLSRMIIDGTDIITASPYHPSGEVEGVPRYRMVFSAGASLVYRLLVSWKIHTWTALFRAYRREVIENVPFKSNDFLALTELLVKSIQNGYTVSEFPTTLRVRQFGQSSMKIARATIAHLKFQSRLIVPALTGSISRVFSARSITPTNHDTFRVTRDTTPSISE